MRVGSGLNGSGSLISASPFATEQSMPLYVEEDPPDNVVDYDDYDMVSEVNLMY